MNHDTLTFLQQYRIVCFCVLSALLQQCGIAVASEPDFTDLSIEELLALKVTSVSKKVQNLSDSAAAIFVITNDDLKKSGVTNIPDALRMVPGLTVARIDSNKWAVNSRSATSRFSDKLLVLIDGRSVYTSAFSGVYWEVQDVMLEDVDRIEVIRGPGATLWGANAVNGVINIITKHGADTLGGLVAIGGGTLEKAFAGVRYGAPLGETTYGRFYAKGFSRGEMQYPTGEDAHDDWDQARGGFRVDSSVTAKDSLSVHGDIYSGKINQQMSLAGYVWSPVDGFFSTVQDATDVSGRNLVALWEHELSTGSRFTLQAYYDETKRDEAFINETQDNFDIEFQHLFTAGERNNIVWGGRYRFSSNNIRNADYPLVLSIDPKIRQDDLFSAFLQDEIMLARDTLWLTLGSKLEHNDYSGGEIEPSARLLWAVQSNHKIWTAISRAVRTPSRVEHDGDLLNASIPSPESFNSASPLYNPSNPLPIELRIVGNQEFGAEKLTAYELGYRFLYSRDLSLDTTIFYNDYDELRLLQQRPPVFNGSTIVQNYVFINSLTAESYGAEFALAWQATDWLKFDLAYSYLESDMNADEQLGDEPHHQASLRGFINLRDNLDLNIWLRYVDTVTAVSALLPGDIWYEIDKYASLDMRLAWRPTAKIELALVGQNLLSNGSVEFLQENFTRPTEIPRSVYGMLSYKF